MSKGGYPKKDKLIPIAEKQGLHPRNKHRQRYNFKELIGTYPQLASFVGINKFQIETIDFANPEAVLALNKALLKHYYGINHWNIPTGYLCPPIPGRADYIYYIADLLASCNGGVVPKNNKVKCLDIGVGANCIYPIVGCNEYGWTFVGSDVEKVSIESALKIVNENIVLKDKIELRLQKNNKNIFEGIIQPEDRFDVTICNPPFHASLQEAQAGTLRKLSNLKHKRITKQTLNFGGKSNELWYEGGEERFIQVMIAQSKQFATTCFWFSTLVAKSAHLKEIYKTLEKFGALEVKTISIAQGNKVSRIVAWTYLSKEQQHQWRETRWK